MKFKIIATACAVLCSASAFAAPLDAQTQAPELTFYIAGASAQKAALTVVAKDLFAVPADVITIKQAAGQKTLGWYGMSKSTLTAGTKRLFVAYNSTNGSNAGVAQLLSNASAEAEANIVTVGNAGCSAAAVVSGVLTSNCTNTAVTEANMALSDVYPGEAVAGVLPAGAGNITIAQLTFKKTALEGFGVVVNPALYAALQTAQGLCAGTAAACQPSIRRADYASLVTVEGTIKDSGALLGNSDTTALTLVRRTDSSGTQAASNIFFANNVCGNLGFLGALGTVGVFDSNSGVFDISEQTGTGGVTAALTGTATAGYALGVVSLENIPTTALTSYQFVKIDGISPNYSAAGVADPLMRNAMASGSYPFAVEMTGMYRKGTLSTAVTKLLGEAVITGLKNSALHNLAGLAYLDLPANYVAGGKQSRVNRGGNNCQPLIN
jgi:hypothetical protein